MAKHNELGRSGEDIACEYLSDKGYTIVERNFMKPYGEIDIIAREKGGLLVFVEVKTVSHEMYRAEENIHDMKLLRLGRVIQAYLASKRHFDDWRFDVVTVHINPTTKQARVNHMEDIVIGS